MVIKKSSNLQVKIHPSKVFFRNKDWILCSIERSKDNINYYLVEPPKKKRE